MMNRLGMMGILAVFSLGAACASDDAAKKDDAANPAADAPAEEAAPAEEEAPAEDPAPAAAAAEDVKVDDAAYEGSAKVTSAKTDDGKNAVRLGDVKADGGYAKCGLQNGDTVLTIAGADVPTGREAVKALREACAKKQAIVVKRGKENVTLGK